MNDASNRIKFESNSLGKLLENGHKALISKSYLCMSSCFKTERAFRNAILVRGGAKPGADCAFRNSIAVDVERESFGNC